MASVSDDQLARVAVDGLEPSINGVRSVRSDLCRDDPGSVRCVRGVAGVRVPGSGIRDLWWSGGWSSAGLGGRAFPVLLGSFLRPHACTNSAAHFRWGARASQMAGRRAVAGAVCRPEERSGTLANAAATTICFVAFRLLAHAGSRSIGSGTTTSPPSGYRWDGGGDVDRQLAFHGSSVHRRDGHHKSGPGSGAQELNGRAAPQRRLRVTSIRWRR